MIKDSNGNYRGKIFNQLNFIISIAILLDNTIANYFNNTVTIYFRWQILQFLLVRSEGIERV